MKKHKIKKETLFLLGFLEDEKNPSLFFRIEENPGKIFLLRSKKKSHVDFLKSKESVSIKIPGAKNKLSLEKIDCINANEKSKLMTFVYGDGKGKTFYWAERKKKNEWNVLGKTKAINERGGIVSDYFFNNSRVLYYGESFIGVAISSDLKKWTKSGEKLLKSRPGFFDRENVKFIAARHCDRGIVVFYDASLRKGEKMKLQIGAALFSAKNPKKVIWRSEHPVFEQEIEYEKNIECKGAIFSKDLAYFYWHSPKREIFSISIIVPFSELFTIKQFEKTERSERNPIINPKPESWWRSMGVFNPTAVDIKGKIHLFFRAIGSDGISRIGHAVTSDGINIEEVYFEPVFYLKYSHFDSKKGEKRYNPILYPSGGSWGGCEDPRVVKIKNRVYMTFNTFDNWDNIRVGLTSINQKDVVKKNWKWKKPQLISPPGRAKNWIFFPEKINGKYALIHNLHADEPDRILVEYVDDINSIDSKKMNFESPDPQRMPNRPIAWHVRMRSAGPAPIKTDQGWLLLYHAHDAAEGYKYKVGALLLDLKDPSKVIARSSLPILVPDTWYENDWKPGIVYACGAIVKDKTLFIYYGGGDKYVCVARTPITDLLYILKKSNTIRPYISKVIIN